MSKNLSNQPKRMSSAERAMAIDRVARAIVESAKKIQDAKTKRLREARMKRDGNISKPLSKTKSVPESR